MNGVTLPLAVQFPVTLAMPSDNHFGNEKNIP